MLTATTDHGGYKRKATDSFKRVHDERPRYTQATQGISKIECIIKSEESYEKLFTNKT
jgi:hypothetical protein